MHDEDKWINRDPRTGKLVIRFRVKGFPSQFFISSRLPDTKRNREIVRLKRDAIANDIALGAFDPTLEKYQFRASAIAPAALVTKKPKAKYQYDLQELWEQFTNFKATQLERTTILGKYRAIAAIVRDLPTRSLVEAAKIRDHLLANYAHFTAWECLSRFSRCGQWATDSGLIPDNPFENLQIQKPKKKSNQGEDYRAFTLEQRDLIIEAFEQHPQHFHYADLIKFMFWTGCRPGEAFALTWGDVSQDCTKISINKSRNLYGIKKGTKNGNRRVFPCKHGSKLQQLLMQIRPDRVKPDVLVFQSKTGRPINTDMLFDAWKESRTGTYRYSGVVKELADDEKLPYLKIYAMRHTFATWAISGGSSPDKVAYWIGDTVETVLKYYCHPEIVKAECPDF